MRFAKDMNSQLIYSLITGIFIGGVAGYLGTLLLSKRMSLAIDPLGHLALPGVALALLYNFDVSLGAFLIILLGMVLIWFFELKTKLPTEALTALVFTLGVALTFLFFPLEEEELERVFIGDISKIGFNDTILAVILSIILFLLIKKIYSKIILINISEDLAKTEGVDTKKYNLLYLLSIAIIVALGVKIVGGLLAAALVAVPAAASRNLSKNLFQFSLFGLMFGVLSPLLGILISELLSLSAGPLIVVVSAFFFLLSLAFKK